jgi:hypothetical protein
VGKGEGKFSAKFLRLLCLSLQFDFTFANGIVFILIVLTISALEIMFQSFKVKVFLELGDDAKTHFAKQWNAPRNPSDSKELTASLCRVRINPVFGLIRVFGQEFDLLKKLSFPKDYVFVYKDGQAQDGDELRCDSISQWSQLVEERDANVWAKTILRIRRPVPLSQPAASDAAASLKQNLIKPFVNKASAAASVFDEAKRSGGAGSGAQKRSRQDQDDDDKDSSKKQRGDGKGGSVIHRVAQFV